VARLGGLKRLVGLVALATIAAASATAQQLRLELASTEVALDDVIAAVVRLVGPATTDFTQPVVRSDGFVAQRLAPKQGRQTPQGRQWRFLLVPVEVGPTQVEVTLDRAGVMLSASADARVTGRGPVEASQSAVSDDVTGRRFVTATLDRPSAYVHEQITYRFRYYFENWLPTGESPQYGLPSFGGFASQIAGQFPADESERVRVDGRAYYVEEIVVALFPIVSGPLEIGETRLVLPRVVDGARDLRTDGASVRVLALPSPEPADFSGGVGEFTIEVTKADDHAEVGQGARFTVRISGRGDLDTLTDFAPPTSSTGDVYAGATRTEADIVDGQVGGVRVMEYIVVPRQAGATTVDFPSISTFSPMRGEYARADAHEVSVTVAAAPATSSPPPPAPASKLSLPVAVAGGLAALVLAGFAIARRLRRTAAPGGRSDLPADVVGAAQTVAALSALELGEGRRVCREIDAALRACLAAILGVDPTQVNAALTDSRAEGASVAAGVLGACSEGMYTPTPPDANAQEELRRRAINAVKLMAGAV
jgi:hypothetical protein